MPRGIQRQAEVYHWRTTPFTAYASWQRIAAFDIPPEWEGTDILAAPKGYPGTQDDWVRHIQGLDTLLNDMRTQGRDSRSMFGNRYDPVKNTTVYTPERQALHNQILNTFLARMQNIPRERKAILMAGLGGAGKTYAQSQPWFGIPDVDKNYFRLSADDIKEEMAKLGMMPTGKDDPRFAGYSPMELSSLIHMESDYLAKKLADIATKQGTNVIWDYRMANLKSATDRIAHLNKHGYNDIGAFLVNVDAPMALRAAIGRHSEGQGKLYSGESPDGGRWLPSYAHHEGDPSDPSMMSSSQEAFNQLITQHPELLPMGWGQVDNRDRNVGAVSMGGSGLWRHLNDAIGKPLQAPQAPQVPAGHPDTLTAPAQPKAPATVTARRIFMADTDPNSVRGLLDAYEQGQITYRDLADGIVARYAQLGPHQADPEQSDWSEYMHSETFPGDDDFFWLESAATWHLLTDAQLAEISAAVDQVLADYHPPMQPEAPFGY